MFGEYADKCNLAMVEVREFICILKDSLILLVLCVMFLFNFVTGNIDDLIPSYLTEDFNRNIGSGAFSFVFIRFHYWA